MSNKPTKAEVLARYLGVTEKTHPRVFRAVPICPICDRQGTRSKTTCNSCGVLIDESDTDFELTLPNPLAPGTAWLGVLDEWFMRSLDEWVVTYGRGICGVMTHWMTDGFLYDESPVRARVRAMMAADPAFREKMEGAEG